MGGTSVLQTLGQKSRSALLVQTPVLYKTDGYYCRRNPSLFQEHCHPLLVQQDFQLQRPLDTYGSDR